MALPSGSGSEILRTAIKGTVSNSFLDLITVVNNHIYTIISVTALEKDNINTHALNLTLYDGSADYYVLRDQSIPSKGTFIFNDKLVLNGPDLNALTSGTNNWKLRCKSATAANSGGLCVIVSYLDQDWT